MTPVVAGVALVFCALGALAERLASVWPAEEASRRAIGVRTLLVALGAGAAGGAVAWRSTLEPWASGVYIVSVGLLVVLTATDLDQRRLPHLLLDPLIVLAIAFVPFNPTVDWRSALLGAGSAVAFLGLLGVLVRGGVARGDLYLVAPLGLLLGWPAIFVAIFMAGLLSAAVSILLLATRRVGLHSYIPFGPFLVAGTLIALVREPGLLGQVATALVGMAAR